jgi:hypothetical protein
MSDKLEHVFDYDRRGWPRWMQEECRKERIEGVNGQPAWRLLWRGEVVGYAFRLGVGGYRVYAATSDAEVRAPNLGSAFLWASRRQMPKEGGLRA